MVSEDNCHATSLWLLLHFQCQFKCIFINYLVSNTLGSTTLQRNMAGQFEMTNAAVCLFITLMLHYNWRLTSCTIPAPLHLIRTTFHQHVINNIQCFLWSHVSSVRGQRDEETRPIVVSPSPAGPNTGRGRLALEPAQGPIGLPYRWQVNYRLGIPLDLDSFPLGGVNKGVTGTRPRCLQMLRLNVKALGGALPRCSCFMPCFNYLQEK